MKKIKLTMDKKREKIMKNTKKLWTTIIIISALLILTFIPTRNYFANREFQQALAFNEAISSLQIHIISETGGKQITPEFLIIRNLNNVKKGFSSPVMPYKSSLTEKVRASWIDTKFTGFDKTGKPKYTYTFVPVSFQIVVISPRQNLIGSQIISIIPNKPFIHKTITIKMQKTQFKRIGNSTQPMEWGGGSSVIEDVQHFIEETRLGYIYSTEGEGTQTIFKNGAIAYIQSVYRTASNVPIYGAWGDNGAVATPVLGNFQTGMLQNGSSAQLKSQVRYCYEREKTVVYTSYGTFVNYRETIYPENILSARSVFGGYIPNPPSYISGNRLYVGSVAGAKHDFYLDGVNEYYNTPGVVFTIGINYGPSGGTVGVSVAINVQKHFTQGIIYEFSVLKTNYQKSLLGFDNGTNWGQIYPRWVSNR